MRLDVALALTMGAWAVFELGLRVREALAGRGRVARDRATRALIAVAIGTAIGLTAATAHRTAATPYRVVGLIAIWLGIALRVWAVVTLGRSFRTTVEVDAGQAVVTSGPYRWVRHPAYTGLLLIVMGFGLAAHEWLGLLICTALPLPALLRRIQVEEAELTRVLGDPYGAYQAQTKRLVPGVW